MTQKILFEDKKAGNMIASGSGDEKNLAEVESWGKRIISGNK
jgi:hypothetical protein